MTTDQESTVLNNMEAALAPQLPKRNPSKKFVGLAVLALLFGIYYYSDVILHYGQADAECIKFAEETNTNPSLSPDLNDKKIFAAKKWVKNGEVVVELGQKSANKKGYQSRLCVIGGGQIRLPSMFEQWQYR
jgi:hypothetical protein